MSHRLGWELAHVVNALGTVVEDVFLMRCFRRRSYGSAT